MGCAEFCGRQRGPAAISLRVVAFVNFLTGLGFIIYGIVLVSPPKTALPMSVVGRARSPGHQACGVAGTGSRTAELPGV